MCFIINTKARRPRRKYVYKRVVERFGSWESPLYYATYDKGKVTKSSVITLSEPSSVKGDLSGETRAVAGIYVFLSKEEAKKNGCVIVIKLAVKPEDWLHTSSDGTMATYKKVKVVGEVL